MTRIERETIERLISEFDESAREVARGRSWESLLTFPDVKQPIIWSGCVGLPMSHREIMKALQHWTELLRQVRARVKGARWRVHVDDHALHWDSRKRAYDLRR